MSKYGSPSNNTPTFSYGTILNKFGEFGLIITVSSKKKKYTNNAIWFDENNYPFNLEIINSILENHYRSGWYYQQLLKLYSLFTIPNITDNILCLDSDTIFLKKTDFFKNQLPYYNYGTANHRPYFKHMKKLLPELQRQDRKKSGITHHMIFNIEIMRELFSKIESLHKTEFWLKFLDLVDRNEKSGASEYTLIIVLKIIKTKSI